MSLISVTRTPDAGPLRRAAPYIALLASVLLHLAILGVIPDWRKALPPAAPALEVRVLPPVPVAVAPAPAPLPEAPKRVARTERDTSPPSNPAAPQPAPPAPILRSESTDAPRMAVPEPPRVASEPAPAAAPSPKPAPVAEAAPRSEPVVPPVYNAAYLRNPAPRYPMLARRAGEQGTVTLRVRVTRDGAPASVLLERSSGSGSLDNAALETVKTWRFVPAKRGEEAVEAWVLVPIVFRLEGTS